MESTLRQVTHLPPVWDNLLHQAYTPHRRDKRLLVCLPKDTGKLGVREIGKVFKQPQWDSNSRPIDRQSRALTTDTVCISPESCKVFLELGGLILD